MPSKETLDMRYGPNSGLECPGGDSLEDRGALMEVCRQGGHLEEVVGRSRSRNMRTSRK